MKPAITNWNLHNQISLFIKWTFLSGILTWEWKTNWKTGRTGLSNNQWIKCFHFPEMPKKGPFTHSSQKAQFWWAVSTILTMSLKASASLTLMCDQSTWFTRLFGGLFSFLTWNTTDQGFSDSCWPTGTESWLRLKQGGGGGALSKHPGYRPFPIDSNGYVDEFKGRGGLFTDGLCRDHAPHDGLSGGAQPHRDQQGQQEESEQEDGSGCTVNLTDNINVPHLFLWDTPIILCLLTAFYSTLLASWSLSCSPAF